MFVVKTALTRPVTHRGMAATFSTSTRNNNFWNRNRECYEIPTEYLNRRKAGETKDMTKANVNVAETIDTFSNNRSEVFEELRNVEKVAGIKWKRFPGCNKLLKGHRRGELTVVTGSTGSGKTTFLAEYSLDLCVQGVRTLWGNFELKNVRLMKLLLNQFAQKPLTKHLDSLDLYASEFEKLPLFFMKFHGEQSFTKVMETMNYAVNEKNVHHIIIDNLQFMVGNRSGRLDKYDYQDYVVGCCRKFATNNNCHVTIVIHPRKELNEELTMNSVFGGGKATQEADNVLILQTKWSGNFRFQKYLQVSKNRYDGDLGIVPIYFNKETQGFGLNLNVREKVKRKVKKYDSDDENSEERIDDEKDVKKYASNEEYVFDENVNIEKLTRKSL